MTTDSPPHRLHGFGRLSWADARPLLAGCGCTWSDLDGIHVTDEPPTGLPVGATHLWGWSRDRQAERWIRLRLDTTAVYAAVLGRDGEPSPPRVLLSEPVTVDWRPTPLWDAGDQQVGQLPPRTRGRAWRLAEITGEHPITFVRAD